MTRDDAADLFNDAETLDGVNASIRAARRWARDHGLIGYDEDPDASGLPLLTPRTWRQYRDADPSGDLGRFYTRITADSYAAPWRDARPMGARRDCRWGSVESALSHWAAVRIDGYPIGSLTDAISALAKMGTFVSGGGGDGKAARLADSISDVDRALAAAFVGHRFELGEATTKAILLARLVGIRSDQYAAAVGAPPPSRADNHGRQGIAFEPVPAAIIAGALGLRVSVIAGVVRRGRRALRVEFAARRLIPDPPARAGLAEAIDRRRRALLAAGYNSRGSQ